MSFNPNAAIESAATSISTTDHQTEQLKKHREIVNQIKAKDSPESNNIHANPDKVARQQNITATQQTNLQQLFKPIFKWEKQNDKTFDIIPNEKITSFNSLYDTNSKSNQILSLLGYKIDISNQVDQFKQKLQKFFIESKSHNPLVGKFSELKFGMVATLLSLLGIEPNTVETLKKEALKKAIQDNLDCFEQNEYNLELLTVFTSSGKDKARIKVLTELRQQLIKQMRNYDQPDLYTKEMIHYIKKKQVQKIMGDLLEEKQNLEYIRNYQ